MTARHLQLADLLELLADVIPDRPALVTNDAELTYAELDERATRLAHHLRDELGVRAGEHVGIHAPNCAEWVEAFYACFKLRAVPINVNHRYVEAELGYLYDNADCVAAIVAPEQVARLTAIRSDLPQLRAVLEIGRSYDAAIAAASPSRDFGERSGDDLYVLYTGGTTGMPKGVMWRNEDIIVAAMNAGRGGRPIESPEALAAEAAAAPAQARLMCIGPMMHGGGQWVMGNAHVMGGVLVLYTLAHFDPIEVWRLAERARVNSVSTIGDAIARPLAEALLAPDRPAFDLSSVVSIGNGGAPLSAAVREQLHQALPNVFILDSFGASETGATGSKIDEGEGLPSPKFVMGDHTTVLADDGRVCEVGEVGMLARRGHIPLGYYRDEAKTAATFRMHAGHRWVVPGDFARIEADGSITLLGRGSVCINSGGEKIYPEEVEAALRSHPAVYDAVVVGTSDERWGERVTALVQLRPDAAPPTDAELVAHCRTVLADYKAPKVVLRVPAVERTVVGKADYRWAAGEAARLLETG
jgi:acyl-CoA synthetase (AMP-forming)/AMP-acid ligase II